MLDRLSGQLDKVIRKIKGRGLLKASDIEEVLKEIRSNLLDADVNLSVVNDFVASIKTKALAEKVIESISPGHQITKIVWEELTALLGGATEKIKLAPAPPTLVMMVGLQGSGKTTTAAKIALHFKEKGKKVMLVAADTQRPAAIEQLALLGDQVGCGIFRAEPGQDPVKVCSLALSGAMDQMYDMVILDTAGRVTLDTALMNELKRLKNTLHPHETIFVADGMIGQEAVNVAGSFNDLVGIDSVILTKMDGDARGGALLSIKTITKKPIKYIGVGERMDALETFHPERIASSLLGMGDVESLVEKVERAYGDINTAAMPDISSGNFTLSDFLTQLQQIKKMGPIEDLLKLLPGMNKFKSMLKSGTPGKELARTEAIISSMNKAERANHNIINASRRRRIAKGSGSTVNDVNKLLKQFMQTRKLMKKMSKMGPSGMMDPGMMNMMNKMGAGRPKKWF